MFERAVLAERLRRTLKARVRKSVGSIPTDCIFFGCFWGCVIFSLHVKQSLGSVQFGNVQSTW